MFYLFAVGSMLGYVLQQTLLIRYARKMDGLSLAFYRALSFIVTLLPLLIGSTASELSAALSHWQMLLAAGFAGGIYLALSYSAYNYLSATYLSSLNIAVTTLLTTWFGWFFFGEVFTPVGWLLMGTIILGVILFGLNYVHFDHLDNRIVKGILIIVIGTIPFSFTKFSVAFLSRLTNPLVIGYFWEIAIGTACLVLLLLRRALFSKPIERIDMRTFLIIAACSLPTLIGTGLFSLATAKGPIAVVAAINSGSLVITALLAWMWYHERVRTMQWISILLILIGIVGLKFLTNE